MKKIFLLLVFLSVYMFAFADPEVTITGPAYVQQGSQQTYYVTFSYTLNNSANVLWNVYGGQVVYSDRSQCTVQWNNANYIGHIEVEDDLFGTTGDLDVNVGFSIQPLSQTIVYGTNAGGIGISGIDPASTTSYQWQASADGFNFSDMLGQQQSGLDPGVLYTTTYFRCNVTINGQLFSTDVSAVVIPALNPGTISIISLPNYNGYPSIYASPATGGQCSTLTYYWEMSVENGAWTNIGNSQTFPNLSSGIKGTTRFRRQVVCASQTLSSNIITVNPIYFSPWQENMNYVRMNVMLVPGIQSWEEADQLPTGQKMQSTIYLDGLGRKIQMVGKETSMSTGGALNDVVQHIEYDGAGQSLKSFLPYVATNSIGLFKADAANAQQSYIRSSYNEDASAPTWGSTELEQSPLARPLVSRLAGTSWGNNYQGVKNDYKYNVANEILIWNIGYAATDYPIANNYYAAGKLDKLVSTDEKGKKVIVFSDDAGRLVLKKVQLDDNAAPNEQDYAGWLFTYNVYDDYGRLRFVVTPKAYRYLHDQNSYSLANYPDMAKQLCFSYFYDSRGRNIVKQSPGQALLYTVYDLNNRPVYTQDGNMAIKQQWLTTLYDVLDRPAATGIVTYSGTRQQLQDFTDNNFSNNGISTLTRAVANVKPDLYSNYREPGRTNYKASNSIVFDDGFSTAGETGAEFTAEIVNGTTVAGETIAYSNNTLPNGSNFMPLTISYYDGYGTDAKPFQPSVNFPSTSVPNIQPFAVTQRTLSIPTGNKVRVLDGDTYSNSDVFLTSTEYYNESGSTIQTLGENIKNGVDVHSAQFDWTGKVTGTNELHNIPGSGYSNFVVTNHYEFDILGRNLSLTKNVNGSNEKIYSITYNDKGQVAKKTLAPDYHDDNNPLSSASSPYGIEQLAYSYNIQGWLTGINKDFALETNTNQHQWETSFGMYLGYDNRDGQFAKARLDGKLTGAIWRTQGDNVVRRFNYDYDNLGRFTQADFHQREKPNDANWAKSVMDFSVSNIQYDENGNLLTMQQNGVAFATKGGISIDNLQYTYKPIANSPANFTGNQLLGVYDNNPGLASANGTMGDFKDGANGAANGTDYDYDNNGNLTQDANKQIGAGGIKYNILDKPYQVKLPQGLITYTYSATGEKLSKTVAPNTPTTANPTKTTWYIGGFVLQDAGNGLALQYIYHEEGRIRLIDHKTPDFSVRPTEEITGGITMPNSKFGVYDYFIKDQQGNTRMVLTEEKQKRYDYCSMEPSAAGYEEAEFGQTSNNEVVARVATPHNQGMDDWASNQSAYVSKLGGPGNANKVGPNKLIKVMAGDHVDMMVNYYLRSPNPSPGPSIVQNVANLIVGLLGGSSSTSSGHALASPIASPGNSNYVGMNDFLQTTQPNNGNMPKAYLNYLFFDENFNFVPYDPTTMLGSYSKQVTNVGDQMDPLIASTVAPKNGYAFVYVSNESDVQTVYFDNLAVTHTRAKILEETHYYAFGLKIQPISAQAFQKPTAPDKFQGDNSDFEEETGWNDFDLRNYDPQTGRWTGIDPYDQFASGYVGMGNDPINNVDPTGGWLEDLSGLEQFAIKHFAPALIGAAIGAVTSPYGESTKGAIRGFLGGLGASYIATEVPWNSVGKWIGNILHGSGLGIDDAWEYLTKEALNQLTDKYGKKKYASDGEKDNDVGNKFEDNWNEYVKGISTIINYEPNTEKSDQYDGGNDENPPVKNVRNIIIDGTANVEHVEIDDAGVRIMTHYRAAWFEVKATSKNIYLGTRNYQIYSEIAHLINSQPVAVALGIAQYNVVTTYGGDSKVGKSVYSFGEKYGVQVLSIQPVYRINKGSVEIRFWHEVSMPGSNLRFPLPYMNIMKYKF